MTQQSLDPKGSSSGKSALIVTNLIKLGGLVVALNEVLIRSGDLRPGALAIAALMMAGAQSLETFIGSFFDTKR